MAKGKKKQSRKAPAKVKSRVRPGTPTVAGSKPSLDPDAAGKAPAPAAASSSVAASRLAPAKQADALANGSAAVQKGPLQVKGLTNLGNTCFFNSALQVRPAYSCRLIMPITVFTIADDSMAKHVYATYIIVSLQNYRP